MPFVGLGSCSEEPIDPSIDLFPSDNQVDAIQRGWMSHGCPEFSAALERDGEVLNVYLVDTATEACDRTCWWDIAYTIADVPAGTWTVISGEAEGEVTVE